MYNNWYTINILMQLNAAIILYYFLNSFNFKRRFIIIKVVLEA